MKHSILLALGLAFALPLYAAKPKPDGAEAPATKPETKPKPKHDPAEMFKKKDKDSDGFLTKEEFTAGAKDGTKAETAFTKKDKDSDNKLSPEEFAGKGGKKKK
jgi:hypothetical protein